METFFIQSFIIDKIETEELLLKRYGNIEYTLNLYFEESCELVSKVYERESEDRLWGRWLAGYRLMDKETFIDPEEYKNKSRVLAVKVDGKLAKEQIEDKVKGTIELTL